MEKIFDAVISLGVLFCLMAGFVFFYIYIIRKESRFYVVDVIISYIDSLSAIAIVVFTWALFHEQLNTIAVLVFSYIWLGYSFLWSHMRQPPLRQSAFIFMRKWSITILFTLLWPIATIRSIMLDMKMHKSYSKHLYCDLSWRIGIVAFWMLLAD